MKLKPLADRVVLKQNKPEVYEVLVAGPGGVVDGKEIVMEVKGGDKVIVNKYSGTNVKIDGDEFVIVRQSDILAVVE